MTNRSSKTTTSNQQSNATATYDPQVTASANNALGAANSILTRPYTPYSGQAVAPLSQNEQTAGMYANTGYAPAVSSVNNANTAFVQGGDNPYAPQAASDVNASATNQYTNKAAGMVTPGNYAGASDAITAGGGSFASAWNAGDIAPYMSNIADPQIALANQDYQQQLAAERGRAAMNSAYGGDRAALQENDLNQRFNQNVASIRGGAFGQALNTFEADQARKLQEGTALGNLASEQASSSNQAAGALSGIGDAAAQRQLAAGTALNAMGATNAGLKLQSGQGQLAAGQTLGNLNAQQVQDLMNTGGAARLVQQANNNFNYGQFLENRDWSVNNLQPLLATLSSIPKNITQTGSSSGTTTTSQQSGATGQILGAAATIAAAYFTGGASLALGAGALGASGAFGGGGGNSFGDQNVAASGPGTSWNGAFQNMYDSLGNQLALPTRSTIGTPNTAFGG